MERRESALVFLISVFITSLLAANVLASKIFMIGAIVAPAGVIAYPVSFLCTDVIGELWGRATARRVVWAGFGASLLFMGLAWLAVRLPAAPLYDAQSAFAGIFEGLGRITLAGLVAYVVSQNYDVWAFDALKRLTGGRHLWLRNNLSTIASQLLDSGIFITLAFAGTMPLNVLAGMVLGQWAVKSALALLDTPFCYLGVELVSRYAPSGRNLVA